MAWNYDEKDIEKETVGGNYLAKSGCYEAKILELEHKKTTNGYGQIVMKLEVDEKETIIYHTYEGKDGVIEFKTRVLNHLLYLNKLKNSADIEKCIGKTIGVMLKGKLSQDKKYINFDLEGVYHLPTKRTATELKENKDAKVVDVKIKQYEAEEPLIKEPIKKEEHKEETSAIDDDFPFA